MASGLVPKTAIIFLSIAVLSLITGSVVPSGKPRMLPAVAAEYTYYSPYPTIGVIA